MPVDKLIDYSTKVCLGQLADYYNKKYKRADSLITLKPFKYTNSPYRPYIRSQTKDLIDLCTLKPCITGKSKRCITRKQTNAFLDDEKSKLCNGTRMLNPTVKDLTLKLNTLLMYYIVSKGLIVGIIDKMDNFNIVFPEKYMNNISEDKVIIID
jgi:hypothetical protein